MLPVQPPPRPRPTFSLLDAPPWRLAPRSGVQARRRLRGLSGLPAPDVRAAEAPAPPPAPLARRSLHWRPTPSATLAGLAPRVGQAEQVLAEAILHALPDAELVRLLAHAADGDPDTDLHASAQGRVVAAEVLRRVRVAARLACRASSARGDEGAAQNAAGEGSEPQAVRLLAEAQRATFAATLALGEPDEAIGLAAAAPARNALRCLGAETGSLPGSLLALLATVRALAYLPHAGGDALAANATQALLLLTRAPKLAPFRLRPDEARTLAGQLQLLTAEIALVTGEAGAIEALLCVAEAPGPHLAAWRRNGGPAAWTALALAHGRVELLRALAALSERASVSIAAQEWLNEVQRAVQLARGADALSEATRAQVDRIYATCRQLPQDPDWAPAVRAAARCVKATAS